MRAPVAGMDAAKSSRDAHSSSRNHPSDEQKARAADGSNSAFSRNDFTGRCFATA